MRIERLWFSFLCMVFVGRQHRCIAISPKQHWHQNGEHCFVTLALLLARIRIEMDFYSLCTCVYKMTNDGPTPIESTHLENHNFLWSRRRNMCVFVVCILRSEFIDISHSKFEYICQTEFRFMSFVWCDTGISSDQSRLTDNLACSGCTIKGNGNEWNGMALMREYKEKYETQMNDFDTKTHLANAIICSDFGLTTKYLHKFHLVCFVSNATFISQNAFQSIYCLEFTLTEITHCVEWMLRRNGTY